MGTFWTRHLLSPVYRYLLGGLMACCLGIVVLMFFHMKEANSRLTNRYQVIQADILEHGFSINRIVLAMDGCINALAGPQDERSRKQLLAYTRKLNSAMRISVKDLEVAERILENRGREELLRKARQTFAEYQAVAEKTRVGIFWVETANDPTSARLAKERFWKSLIELGDVLAAYNDHYIEIGHLYFKFLQSSIDESFGYQRIMLGGLALLGLPLLLLLLTGFRYMQRARELESESQQEFSQLFDTSIDAIGFADPQARIGTVNQAMLNLTGYSQEEMAGKSIFSFLSPNYRDAFDDQQQEQLESRGYAEEIDTELICKDGGTVPVSMRIWLSTDSRNRITGIWSIFRDVTESRKARERLQQNLKEKEILLKEIHHRVKNNLHMVSGLLYLQSQYAVHDEDLRLFQDSQNRIKSMALVHEVLYLNESLANIDFRTYVDLLVQRLMQGMGIKGITYRVSVSKVELGVEKAVPCGLLLNELITNSLKHAFADKSNGLLEVIMRTQNSHIILEVRDNGKGIDPDIDLRNTSSLGMQLVWNLVDQLDGELTWYSDNGTVFRFEFIP